MAITEEGFFVCEYCSEDTGKFDQITGNHPQCAELARVKAERDEAVELLEEILQKKIAAFLAKAKP